ncbi:MAG: helix-turn-helix domain-containing protein [Mesorhizobium sp.]|jgi:DNA-binding transcriptional MerR regulator|nr:helix-turn-helix domain-containing protein [Mesorhizobium sp.]MBL8577220.1 helix-turn-helix domain-containing protein [Mesorhizobium sp.]
MLTIGELSRFSGVKIPTIRYYEQSGLIGEAARTAGNQRRYCAADRERLLFIKNARELGFSTEAVRDLLALGDLPDAGCEQAHRIAARQLAVVREKIAYLRGLETRLKCLSNRPHSGGRVVDCTVMKGLADHGRCECGRRDG